jgi:hypothetical protein
VSEKLQANTCELSIKFDGSAPFVPHITVIGGILCETNDDVMELTRTLRKGLQGIGGIQCRFRDEIVTMYHPDSSLVWNQACVSVVERTDGFMLLHERVRKILGIEDGEWEFPAPIREPHLSHFYGTDMPPSLDDVLVSPNFVAKELALWETSGGYDGVSNWKELARIKLS